MSADQRRLQDDLALLKRSLADAQSEYERGELDQESFEKLKLRDQAHIAKIHSELSVLNGEGRDAPDGEATDRAGRSLSKTWIFAIALVVVLLGGGLMWWLSGSSASSSNQTDAIVTLVNQADNDVQHGKAAEALVLYNRVLKMDPTQSQALAESGWLTFEAGTVAGSKALVAHGEQLVSEASRVDPSLYAAHLYLGVMELLANHDPKAALAQFKAFESCHPPAKWRNLAQPYIADAKKALA